MKLIDLLIKELPRHGGWPDGCVAISLNSSGQVWPHSKMPTRYIDVLGFGAWTDDTLLGRSTAGFSRPIFLTSRHGGSSTRPVTQGDYYDRLAELGDTK